jgi:two-component system chemotaxis response regulator CheB
MPGPAIRRVVAIGGSAGGVGVLRTILAELPGDLAAPLLVVIHQWPGADSVLPAVLSRAGPLPAAHAGDRDLIEPGKIYVAPPDRHLLLQNGCVRAYFGPNENRHRPSIDVLFRSVSQAYGDRAIGVLLSGADDDGAAGLHAIQRNGGVAIIQDPEEAQFPAMPLSALRHFTPDFRLPAAEIGPALSRLVGQGTESMGDPPLETREPREQIPEGSEEKLGHPTAFTCPDCGGSLWELTEGELMRFRCRVGHAFSPAAMLEAESDMVEKALWQSVRVLMESAAVCRRIARRAGRLHKDFSQRADDRERCAEIIREFIESGNFRT